MTNISLLYSTRKTLLEKILLAVLFIAWALFVAQLVTKHDPWRDEVRALTIALDGKSVVEMLRTLHGEGHPAVWYLLLRGTHALLGTPLVLPVVALVVMLGAVFLLVTKSPFGLPMIALMMSGDFILFEYSVYARNYGISMLALFALAWAYPRFSRRGILLGILLLLLMNCNAPSVFLAGGFLLFWLIDLLQNASDHKVRNLKLYAVNAGIAAMGAIAFVLTVFPTYNDAAAIFANTNGSLMPSVWRGLFLPGAQFSLLSYDQKFIHFFQRFGGESLQIATSVLLFGSTLGLIRRLGAVTAAFVTLVTLSLFFALVCVGSYRHQALWLTFLISMYWIAGQNTVPLRAWYRPQYERFIGSVECIGKLFFVLLVALQIEYGTARAMQVWNGIAAPVSEARDFSRFLATQPQLKDAIIMANPDYFLETLPYYMDNPTYLMHEGRFGNIVHFTNKARLEFSLQNLLDEARILHTQTGKPVIILIKLSQNPLPYTQHDGYNWALDISTEDRQNFLAATTLLKSFPLAMTDEIYDAYLLVK